MKTLPSPDFNSATDLRGLWWTAFLIYPAETRIGCMDRVSCIQCYSKFAGIYRICHVLALDFANDRLDGSFHLVRHQLHPDTRTQEIHYRPRSVQLLVRRSCPDGTSLWRKLLPCLASVGFEKAQRCQPLRNRVRSQLPGAQHRRLILPVYSRPSWSGERWKCRW